MELKLYVGNLSYDVTENDLRELFGQAGAVKEVTLITDRYTQESKGFGFVEMVNQTDAEKAIRMFNNQEVQGRRVNVSFARAREEHDSGRGSRRNFSSRGGRTRY